MHHSFAPAIRPGASIILVVDAGPDGCCRLLNSGVFPGLPGIERGKSELRRAVCRITSGKAGSRLSDGKCHREYTAPPFWVGVRCTAEGRQERRREGGNRG